MDMKKTGNLISSARRAKGLTQKELAEHLHVSDRAVSKWERGAGFPDVSILTELADVLGITVTELLKGELHQTAADSEDAVNSADMTEVELSVREAVQSIYQQTRTKAKKNRAQILVAVLITVLIAGGAGLALKRLGEDRILFPPKINCEILQGHGEVDFAGEILVDRANTGVYGYTCRYEIDRYGSVQLADRSLWQSYDDTVPSDVYDTLQNLCAGEMYSIWTLDGGFLAEYQGNVNGMVTLIETDADCQPVFTYEYDSSPYSSPCVTAFLSDGKLYVVSYNSDEERMYLTSVDKENGSAERYSFTYGDLSGKDAAEERRIGGFLFDGRSMWVKDGVLYFAETHYVGGSTAVFAALDLDTCQPLYYREVPGAHVVLVKQDLDAGRVSVLLDPMNYEPLQLSELDASIMEVLHVTELELPHEYLTNQESRERGSYLFEADINEEAVLVKFSDVYSEAQLRDQVGSCILAMYDRNSGDMTWRARLSMDAEYDVYDVKISDVNQ